MKIDHLSVEIWCLLLEIKNEKQSQPTVEPRKLFKPVQETPLLKKNTKLEDSKASKKQKISFPISLVSVQHLQAARLRLIAQTFQKRKRISWHFLMKK